MTTSIRDLTSWLWRSSRGLRLQAALNALIGIMSVTLDFAFIYATKWTIDIATNRAEGSLRVAAYTLAGIMLSKILLGFARKWVGALLGVRSQNILQKRLFTHLLRSEWNGQEDRHSGDTLNRIERDVRDLTSCITETVPAMLEVSYRFVGAFFYLFHMDARLACLIVCIVPCFLILSKVYVRKMRAITRDIRSTESRVQSILQESIQHRAILKTLERVGTMIEKLEQTQRELRRHVRHRAVFSSSSSTLLSIGFGTGYLVTFLWGVNSLQEESITYGMMISFIQLVGQIQGPFRDMTRFIPVLISTLTASERLMELEDHPLEDDANPITFPDGAGVRLKDVSFYYKEGGRAILSHFSCDFPKGTTTAILGETGAGKTTLIRLILALLKPTEGQVEMYDEARTEKASPRTRCNLVYVPQGNTLFSGTIRDNLLLGNPDATEQEMREVLETACAGFVMNRPDGLDTVCGELGAGLSEGQAQRIAIARALLRKGSVLLLDEATSALDMQTEQQLLRNLSNREAGQTIICVTHRPAVIEYCSQVIEMKRADATVKTAS
ncbi:MAG: ABC transporter ATP-binding protein [Bacteroidaceae bacterium]|nr:ABC transporter ATP-binding protein [Bacteroidaceae bacterium]